MVAVLLKDLVARPPHMEDLSAVSGLVVICESKESGMANRWLEEVRSLWQQPGFHLANDAWVISTTRGQIVGFACIWREERVQISTFVCVHPAYRNRGIGTLLLRRVEVRARQYSRLARPDEHMVLRILISGENEGAQRLFEREGYLPGRLFLRISFQSTDDTGALLMPGTPKKLRVTVNLEQGQMLGATPLYDKDGCCTVHPYRIYEKELCSIPAHSIEAKTNSLRNF